MMTWRYLKLGNHMHVRVYMNAALCGRLTFRITEFNAIKHAIEANNARTKNHIPLINFQQETNFGPTQR